MNRDSRILFLVHRVAGPLDSVLAGAGLLFSASERIRYRRLANASALLRLGLNPTDGDDDGILITRRPALTKWLPIAGLTLLGTVAFFSLHHSPVRACLGGGHGHPAVSHVCLGRAL